MVAIKRSIVRSVGALFLLDVALHGAETVSFTANGRWGPVADMVPPSSNGSICMDRFMCTPNNNTWIADYPHTLFDVESGCKALLDKGIKTIHFHGDSYMRQIYAAMLITLNGDYEYGSIANSTINPHCQYHTQFREKGCGTVQLNHNGVVCDGKIHLDPLLTGFGNLDACSRAEGCVVLFSFGNHQLGRGRYGVNNHTAFSELFEEGVCRAIKGDDATRLAARNSTNSTDSVAAVSAAPHKCSVWWVSTHHRNRAIFDDESDIIVREFNVGMRKFFDSKRCGDVGYVDVFNMTEALVQDHKAEANTMTYDGVHWGYEANLWKAQIILSALAK